MKFLFDLLPVILFFTAFKFSEKNPEGAATFFTDTLGLALADPKQAPILIATLVVILATIVQIVWVWHRHGKVDKMLWFSLALVIFFGGMTLVFQDESFIKWKPTILYWGFAVSMIAASLAGKNGIRAMLSQQMELPEVAWKRLNWSWIAFFVFMGGANLYVAFNYSTDTWVDFKLFGGFGLMLVFVLAQGLLLSKYVEEK